MQNGWLYEIDLKRQLNSLLKYSSRAERVQKSRQASRSDETFTAIGEQRNCETTIQRCRILQIYLNYTLTHFKLSDYLRVIKLYTSGCWRMNH